MASASFSDLSKDLSTAEERYRSIQQQHHACLEQQLLDKDNQLMEGQHIFNQLKDDFKYNLRLLQERDTELENNEVQLDRLRQEVNAKTSQVSDLFVALEQANDTTLRLEAELRCSQTKCEREAGAHRVELARAVQECKQAQATEVDLLQVEVRKLKQQLVIMEEQRRSDHNSAKFHYDDQIHSVTEEWRSRVDEVNAKTLELSLKLSSSEKEVVKLRSDLEIQNALVTAHMGEKRELETELKEVQWEVEDYRAMSNQRILELEQQLKTKELASQALMDKYESKLAQANIRLTEVTERHEKQTITHTERQSELNAKLNAAIADGQQKDAELARLHWQLEDQQTELVKAKNTFEKEKVKLVESYSSKVDGVQVNILRDEVNHLKKTLTSMQANLSSKQADVEKYQQDLVSLNERLAENQRRSAQIEVDCQRRVEMAKNCHYHKSETVISSLSKTSNEAQAAVMNHEKELTVQKALISGLKKERDELMEVVRSNGWGAATPGVLQSTRGIPTPELSTLQQQNISLKSVITQMRKEMEELNKANGKSEGLPGVPSIGTSVISSSNKSYLQSLEQQVQQLKSEIRCLKPTPIMDLSSEDALKLAAGAPNESAIREIVASLNAQLSSTRAEKVQLTVQTRKQQVEIAQLKSKAHGKQIAKSGQLESEQLAYELSALQRKYQAEADSSRHRVNDLEQRLDMTQEEASGYHSALLQSESQNQDLQNELTSLKLSAGRAGRVINYGAQELVIQNLEDENERLRSKLLGFNVEEITIGKPQHALSQAVAQLSQLRKEKAVLTELSNRLRAQLLKAGMKIKPTVQQAAVHASCPTSADGNQPGVDQPYEPFLQNKLDQLEDRHYNLVKEELVRRTKPSIPDKSSFEDVVTKLVSDEAPSVAAERSQGRRVGRKPQGEIERLPDVVEAESSSTGSSMKARGSRANLRERDARKPKYEALPPKQPPKTNVPWISGQPNGRKSPVKASSKGLELNRGSNNSMGLSSMEADSTLREMWDMLEEEKSQFSTDTNVSERY